MNEFVSYTLRFPVGMRDQFHALARANGRSLQRELIQRLSAYEEGGDSIDRTRAWALSASRNKSDQYIVRLPMDLRDSINRAAARDGRSMNSEILHRVLWNEELEKQAAPAPAEQPDHGGSPAQSARQRPYRTRAPGIEELIEAMDRNAVRIEAAIHELSRQVAATRSAP